jgi:dephospho-CoA kinase
MKHTLNVSREVSVVKIALTGKLRSGKDTVAHHLYIKYGFNRVAFGDALKHNAHETFPWISQSTKPRALYQQFGQLMREIDPDVWIKHAERAVNGAIDFRVNTGAERVGVVITDLRQPNEWQWAKDNGFTIIRVTAPDEVRIGRAIAAGDDFCENDLEHETEKAIDEFEVDAEIVNNGTVEELQSKVDSVVEAIALVSKKFNGVK